MSRPIYISAAAQDRARLNAQLKFPRRGLRRICKSCFDFVPPKMLNCPHCGKAMR